MLKIIPCLVALTLLFGCSNTLIRYGRHYQKFGDYKSLQHIVDHLPSNADTALVKRILGEPIDMGFDYRYLIDSTGPGGCVVGAVFHINDAGKIDQQWLGEICE